MIISFIHTRAHVIPVINSNTLSGMEFCFLRGPSALLLLLFLRRVRYQAAYCYERNLDWKRAEYHWRSFYETSNRFEEEDTRNRGRDDDEAGDESGREKIGV